MKINKIFKRFALISLVGAVAAGCYEDKGNYDYDNLRETYITGISPVYYRIMGEDTVSINPVLHEVTWENATRTSDYADPAGYTFEWMLINGKVDGVSYNQYVFSTEPQLDKYALNLAEGTHEFCLKVTNKDGVSFFSDEFEVQVESSLGRGLLIMCEVDNATRLDYLNIFGKKVSLITDVIGKVGSEAPLVGKPLAVACYYDNSAPNVAGGIGQTGGYAVGIMTETDSYFLEASDFSYESDYDFRSHFIIKPPYNFRPSKINVISASYVTNTAMMYDTGTKNIYFFSGMMWLFWSQDNIASKMLGTTFAASPHFSCSAMYWVIFNDETKSFYRVMGMMGMVQACSNSLLVNTGKDLAFLHESNSYAYAIMKDPVTGNYSLISFESMSESNVNSYDLNLQEGSKIEEFAMRWNAATPLIYYRTDEKIYALNTSTLASTQVYSTTDAKRKGGTMISRIKFVRNAFSGTETGWQDNLMVFTYDPSLPEDSCGTLEMYKSTGANGELELVNYENQNMLYNGLGKVVDADFKQK